MFLLLALFFLIPLYFYSTRNYNYWAKRNVKHDRPLPFFGNHLPNQLGLKSITEMSVIMYNKYPKEKVIGYYRGATPMLIIKDLDLIKQILITDFTSFYIRDSDRNPDLELIYRSLAHSQDDNWRLLRKCWSPFFTTARFRAMAPLILSCTEKLQDMVEDIANSGKPYDALDLMKRFNMELTGVCGFGINMNTINKEPSKFLDLGNAIFGPTFRNRILGPMAEIFPVVKKFIRIDNKRVEQGSKDILELAKLTRMGKLKSRDFIDLLLETEAKGRIVGEAMEKHSQTKLDMDLENQIAQVFIFFTAGFKNSGLVNGHVLHALAFHPELQEKIQEEIDTVLSKHNGKLCYKALSEMTLLDMAIKESLRMLLPAGTLRRVCTRKYKIPGLDITIDPGVLIQIPIQAIHMDEEYYDNPTQYRPERFSPEAVKKRPSLAYLPFGTGPRYCVGNRLAQLQSLAGLSAILHKFKVHPKTNNKGFHVIPTYNLVQSIDGGFPLIFKARNK